MTNFREIKSLIDLISKIELLQEKDIHKNLRLSLQLHDLVENSCHKPKYDINILDITNIEESLTSKIIALILGYVKEKDFLICRSFIEHFLVPRGFDMDWFKKPQITTEKEKVDICIREPGKYAIIIENKLKSAPFQRNQIARYIQNMRKSSFSDERIFIVVLPGYVDKELFQHSNKSIWRLPFDWDSPNQKRACVGNDQYNCKCDIGESCQMCTTCKTDIREKFLGKTVIIDTEMIEWMKTSCMGIIPSDEYILRSAIIQFVEFLKGRYNKKFNILLTMEMNKFLREELLSNECSTLEKWESIEQKKNDIQNLLTGLTNLQTDIGLDLIDEWRNQLEPKWGNWLKKENHKSFGIRINGVWCGCWCENKEPFWGFQYSSYSEEQKTMVNKIIERAGFNTKKPGGTWYAWDYTLNGAEHCNALYQAAVELGYLK